VAVRIVYAFPQSGKINAKCLILLTDKSVLLAFWFSEDRLVPFFVICAFLL